MNWIDVKDKLPKFKETVLVWHDNNGLEDWDVGVGYMDNNIWYIWGFDEYKEDEIRFWMPSPKPPNKYGL